MSEFFGEAFVAIRPDLTGFKTALTTGIKEKLGTGFVVPVKVVPVTTGFQKSLREQLAKIPPIPVAVIPETKGFRGAVVAKVGKLPPIPVEVLPNTAALKTALAGIKSQKVPPVVVEVLPDVAAFETALAGLEAQVKAVNVPVTASVVGATVAKSAAATTAPVQVLPEVGAEFQTLLVEKIGKLPPVPVNVVPNVAEFEAALVALAAQAKAIPVAASVVETAAAVPPVTGKTAAGTATKEAAAKATLDLTAANLKLTKSEEILNKVLAGNAEGDDKEIALKEALRLATAGLADANKQAAVAVKALTAEEVDLLAAARGTAEFIIGQTAALRGLGAGAGAGAAQAESIIKSTQQLAIARERLTLSEEAGISVEDKLIHLSAAREAAANAEAAAINEIATAQVRAATGAAGAAGAQAAADATRIEAINLREATGQQIALAEATQITSAAEDSFAKASASASAIQSVEFKRIKDVTKIKEVLAEVTKALHDVSLAQAEAEKAVAFAETQENEAGKALLVTQNERIRQTKVLTDALLAQRAAGRTQIRSLATGARQEEAFTRGATTAPLAAAGLRGATLAASKPFLLGAATAVGLLKAVEAAKEFQTQLALVAAATGADRDEIVKISKAAVQLGKDLKLPLTSAVDAEQAIASLARAGFSLTDSLRSARGVLLLAAGGEISIAAATKLAVQSMESFNLKAKDTVEVADVLTNASLATQASLSDVATALGNVGAPAAKLGLTFKDTTALLVELAKGGLNAADAGTVLRTGLLRLIVPTGKARKELDSLNVSIRDTQGRVRPDVFIRIGDALQNLTKRQRDAALGIIFSQRGIRAAQILTQQGLEGLTAAQAQVGQSGRAFEEASARASTLAGHMTELKKSLQDAGTAIATPLIPQVNSLVDSFSSLVQLIPKLLSGLDSLSRVKPIGGLRAAAGENLGAITTSLLAFVAARKVAGSFAGQEKGSIALFAGNLAGTASRLKNFTSEVIRGREAASVAVSRIALYGSAVENVGAAAAVSASRLSIFAGGIAALASGPVAIAAGAALAAGAIFFLATREDAATKSGKALLKNTLELGDALDQQAQDISNLARARVTVSEDQLANQRAQAQKLSAQAALAASSAPEGSSERVGLLTNLRTATDAAKIAQLDYNDALREQHRLSLLAEKDQRDIAAARDKDTIALQKHLLFSIAQDRFDRSRGGIVGFAKRLIVPFSPIGTGDAAGKKTAEDLKAVRDELLKQAKVLHETGLASDEEFSRREKAVAGLSVALNKVPKAKELSLIFHAPDQVTFARQLAKFEGIAGVSGRKTAAAFLRGLDQIAAGKGILGKLSKFGFDKDFLIKLAIKFPDKNAFIRELEKFVPDSILIKLKIIVPSIDPTEINSKLRDTFNQQVVVAEKAGQESGKAFVAGFAAQLTALDQKLTEAIFQGAGIGAQNAILQQGIAKDVAQVATLKAKKPLPAGSKAAQTRAANIAAAEADATAKRQQIESNNQSVAQKAQEAASKADEAFLNRQEKNRQRIEHLITRAGRTASFEDDIKFNRALVRIFQKQKKALLARLAVLQKAGEDTKAIQAAIDAANEQIFTLTKTTLPDLAKQQHDFIKAQQAQRQADIIERLDLRIQIADDRGDTAAAIRARIAARVAKLKELSRELKKLTDAKKGNTLEALRLRAAIADENKEIKDLKKTTDERNKSFQEFLFAQLQAQQGFAANILNNILPVGNFTGAVGRGPGILSTAGGGFSGGGGGGGGGVIGTLGDLAQVSGGFEQPRGSGFSSDIKTAAAVAAGAGGPTRGGQSRELFLLEAILRVLKDVHRGAGFPASKYERAKSTSSMDHQST